MPDYALPNVTVKPDEVVRRPVSGSTVKWKGESFDVWLADNRLAGWARTWIESLRCKYSDRLTTLVAAGLGGHRELPLWLTARSPEATWLLNYLDKTDLAPEWFNKGFLQDDPAWLVRLLRSEQGKIARSFLLTGNIADYAFDPVNGYRPSVSLLIDTMKQIKDCVLTYRLSQGLKLHARDVEATRKKLPDSIQDELKPHRYNPQESLMGRVCRLFDVLRVWLTGEGGEACHPAKEQFPDGVAIIFENLHLIISAQRGDMERSYLVDNLLHWSNSPRMFQDPHCLILMADSLDDVSDDFRAQGCKIEQIPIPRPGSSDSRLKFLFPLLDPGGAMSETRVGRMVESRRWLEDYDPQAGEGYLQSLSRFASDTSGLTLIGIEDLLQQASQSQEGRLKREQVVQLKRDRLQQESGGMVEVVDPHRTLDDIGGYKHLKDRIREIVHDLRSPSKLSAQTIPMGVLFLGPPGTGKSIVAEALAGESGLNMVKLGDFRGKYVGESERNLSRVFSVLESLHPVIVFIDEIDQALGRRGAEAGDGGVDRRIFGRFLEFMSDTTHRGRILWIGAANLPGNIDSAFKRPGRFDLILAFTRPDSTSRADIIKKILEGKLRDVEEVAVRLSGDDYSSLAQKTPDYTGAELEAIVAEVLRRLARASSGSATARVVDRVLIERVLADYRPPARSRLEYQQMEDMALKEISFWDQLSKEIRDKTGTESSGKNEGS